MVRPSRSNLQVGWGTLFMLGLILTADSEIAMVHHLLSTESSRRRVVCLPLSFLTLLCLEKAGLSELEAHSLSDSEDNFRRPFCLLTFASLQSFSISCVTLMRPRSLCGTLDSIVWGEFRNFGLHSLSAVRSLFSVIWSLFLSLPLLPLSLTSP